MKKDKNVIISNPEDLRRKIETIRRDGPGKLHVLADFDRTLTYSVVDGRSRPSLIAILRQEKYLTPDYPAKAHALKDKYRPVEYDYSLPLEERKKAMHEWWVKHFELFKESRLNIRDIEKAVTSGAVRLREGVTDFFERLRTLHVPLVIMSASGIGGESIEIFLEKENLLLDNVSIVANSFEWDKDGHIVKAKEPIIHSLNKDETAIHQFPVYDLVKNRKNILLLGDNDGDAGMSEGFDSENVIKVGFLNEYTEENLKHFQKFYDVVLLNDPPFDYVNGLLKEIIKS